MSSHTSFLSAEAVQPPSKQGNANCDHHFRKIDFFEGQLSRAQRDPEEDDRVHKASKAGKELEVEVDPWKQELEEGGDKHLCQTTKQIELASSIGFGTDTRRETRLLKYKQDQKRRKGSQQDGKPFNRYGLSSDPKNQVAS